MKIAYFAPIYYDYLKQRPQHFAELLSANHEVIYIEPTISLMKYLLKGGKHFKAIDYDVNTNLKIIRKNGVLTLHKSLEFFDQLNLNSTSEYVQLYKCVNGCDVIWVGYPGWYGVISRFKNKKIIYDKMDEDSQIATNPMLRKLLKRMESKLVKRADLIFVSCQKFYDQLKDVGKRVIILRNGVPLDFMMQHADQDHKDENTIFGYVGTISHWFDFEILTTILKSNQNNKIILVGNNQMPEMIHERIQYIGAVEKERIPEFINKFDVCLYNFKKNALLDTINPVKIYEYLALNKPVLAVESKEIVPLADKLMMYRDIGEVEEYLAGDFLKPFDNNADRECFIKQNSWETRASVIEEALADL